jgi:DNA invertase Pin-like site-specific DNA recombinase
MIKAAIYARFSTDRQNESSIADQNRVCTEWCDREGVAVAARFEDQGISGAALGNRPGVLAMLQAAQSGRFDVLAVIDLSRLSRSQADLPKMIDRLTARGVRVVGVQDGYDNQRRGHKLQAGLSGIMGEAFREMIADRTHAALQSRAMESRPTGGTRYGYADGEAEVVRQIFTWYADGCSPQWIANELNRRGVPSPGSTWNRETRRRGGWHPSAVGGDPKRGIGLLNNEAYIGRRVWNRSKWIKDPDTGKRRQLTRPRADWIIRDDESLRIVPQALWDRVKARQRIRSEDIGSRIKAGHRSPGRAPRYLFSGLLKCELCGSSMVTSDGRGYMCSGYLNGRICTNNLRAPRLRAEARLLGTIKRDLLTDSAIAEFKRRLRRAMGRPDPTAQTRKRLEAEIEHVSDAIAKGLLSPTLARRLQEAEAALKALPAAPVMRLDDVLRALPHAVERYRSMVANFQEAPVDVPRARNELRALIGEIPVEPRGNRLIAKLGLRMQPQTMQIGVVAGACFGICLLRLPRRKTP